MAEEMRCGCPGSMSRDFRKDAAKSKTTARLESELQQWPVQLHLVGPGAPYFDDADLLIAADCTAFAYANFHPDFIKGRAVVIGCPKLDETESYAEKLAGIIREGNVKQVTLVHMEVPCCYGLRHIVDEAIGMSGKQIPVHTHVISIRGEKLQGEK